LFRVAGENIAAFQISSKSSDPAWNCSASAQRTRHRKKAGQNFRQDRLVFAFIRGFCDWQCYFWKRWSTQEEDCEMNKCLSFGYLTTKYHLSKAASETPGWSERQLSKRWTKVWFSCISEAKSQQKSPSGNCKRRKWSISVKPLDMILDPPHDSGQNRKAASSWARRRCQRLRWV